MKKTIALLVALLLTMACGAGFGEEESLLPGLFELYRVDTEEPVWLGTAVSPYEGILVTAAGVLPDEMTSLVASDGRNIWEAAAASDDRAGLAVMIVFDPETTQPQIGIFELDDGTTRPEACYVITGDENISRVNRDVRSAAPFTWRGADCMVLSLSGDVAPGSPLITPEGKLAGIAVGEYAEGSGRVIFLTTEGLVQSLAESLETLTGGITAEPPEGLTLTMDANLATIDWSGMTLPETAEGESLYLVIQDTMNSYWTYFPVSGDGTSVSMILTPGRTYRYSLAAYAGEPDGISFPYGEIELPEAEKMTDYGFVSRKIAIAEAPEGMKGTDLPIPVAEVTEELLRSGDAYFYSASTYQVTERIEDISLLVTLTDPNGNNYCYQSGWLYDPECMEDDTWAVPLDDTGLLEMLNVYGYPAGTYEVAMYIGGKLADSFTFELK